MELLSIIFRLAGNDEYHMDRLPVYSADIDRYFAPYKNHACVQMATAMARKEHGVGFDAVMSMAISLSPPPELKPLVTFSPTIPDKRWGEADAEKFLHLLRDFYRESKFATFYEAHRPMYELAEQCFTTTLRAVDFGWYSRFYGKASDLTYHLILGMNNGGSNYGPRLVHPDGRMEMFSIIGCWTHEESGNPTYPSDQGYLATIIHEFNHSFVNPAVDDHWRDFSGADQVYTTVARQMQRGAYGNAQTMVNESLVRAAVIIYFLESGEDARMNLKRVRQEQQRGFFWMDRLVEQLKSYEAQRTQYPTFASYIPALASFFRELAAHANTDLAAFDAKCAHVAAMQPFANHEHDVDPTIKTITIVVDKPLSPGTYSINGAGGSSPIAGTAQLSSDGLHINLPVQLKPNQSYSFAPTPMAFSTLDGYPLVEYKVEFNTR